MHILILEAGLTGHHANYLEHIAATFLQQGHRLTISVREEHADNPLFARLQASHPGRVAIKTIVPLPSWTLVFGRLGVVGSELRNWLMFKCFFEQLSTKQRVDHVFMPYLDYCLYATALIGAPWGRTKWSGICMRPSFHHTKVGVIAPVTKWASIKQQLFLKLLKLPGLKTIYTIDELLAPYVAGVSRTLVKKLKYLPDPAELPDRYTQTTARALLNIDNEEFVILVYGAIDERKGINSLVNAIHGQQFSRTLRILVVGRQTPALRVQLSQVPMVTSIDQYVGTDIEEAVFRAANATWMGYRSHYSMSGVLVLAAIANKPVIATRNGLIGWLTQKYQLGIAIDCEDPKTVANTIQQIISIDGTDTGSKSKFIKETHSWHRFNTIITTNVQHSD